MNTTANTQDIGTVLIVDDEPQNLALLHGALDDAGYRVLVAMDGAGALQRLEKRHPDLILLDALMPGLDGFQTCRAIKADDAFADIPVLFMTALTESNHVIEGFSAGAVDYVTKPIDCQELLARVAAHLRTARRIRAAHSIPRPAAPNMQSLEGKHHLAKRFSLTERELEVLHWVTCGKTNKDIADILGLSARTVNKHLEHIFVKLGVETRTAATSIALLQAS